MLLNPHSLKDHPWTIALEGLDGAGKSTQIKLLAQKFASSGKNVGVFCYTANRNDVLGKLIRFLYRSKKNSLNRVVKNNRLLQEFLFSRQAAMNLAELGDLCAYNIILCDRCAVTAFIAHLNSQSNNTRYSKIIEWLESPFVPRQVIYLHLPVAIAMQRLSARGLSWNDERVSKLYEMEKNYLNLISGVWCPSVIKDIQWYKVDANLPLEMVTELIWESIN